MYLNTFGNEAINGWDGTKLEIDKEKGKYIFAPQIGAGEKDSQNKFTGVVMGKDSSQEKIGLYGYAEGINTFGLKADGTAYFGAESTGRITIDGKNAVIYGGKSRGENNSMVLRLYDEYVAASSDTRAIEIKKDSSDNKTSFYVTYNGKMYANDVEVTGNITATTLTATESGTIADFTIDSTGLTGGSITCDKLIANKAGEIVGWSFSTNELIGGKTQLNSTSGIFTNALTIRDEAGTSSYGNIGVLYGSNDGNDITTNLGISSTLGHSIILESSNNIRLTAKKTKVILDADRIEITGNSLAVTTPTADGQEGIYARFA